MNRGGRRDNAGRKPKWDGFDTRSKRIPIGVPDALIEDFLQICIDLENAGIDYGDFTIAEIIQAHVKLTMK